MPATSVADSRLPALRLAALVLLVILAISGWMAGDKATWLLETLPVMIALPLLAFTHRR